MVQKLNIEGLSLLVRDCNRNLACIFLHGFPDTKEVWNPIVAGLPDNCSWVTLDFPSFGESLLVDDHEMKLDSIVDRLSRAIESLPFQKYVLVGHDWGGMIAWLSLDKLAGRLEKLILINGPHPFLYHQLINSSVEQGKIAQYASAFCRDNAAEKLLAQEMKGLTLFHPFPQSDATYSEEIFRKKWSDTHRLNQALGIYRANLDAIKAGHVRDPWSQVPTCVIWGVDDHALVSDNYKLMSSKCQSTFDCHELKGGHWVYLENPKTVTEILTRELTSISTSEAT